MSASILDLLSALSVAALEAANYASTLDLRRALSAASSASNLDLLSLEAAISA
jgi:hypothetical protein